MGCYSFIVPPTSRLMLHTYRELNMHLMNTCKEFSNLGEGISLEEEGISGWEFVLREEFEG